MRAHGALMVAAAAAVLCVAACAAVAAGPAALSVAVSDAGDFAITFDGKLWLQGGETQVDGMSSSAGTLKVTGKTTVTGSDALGAYSGTELQWSSTANTTLMKTAFRTYAADPGVIVFTQEFPQAIGPTAATRQAAAALAETPLWDNFAKCRVVTDSFSLTGSAQGYAAFTPAATAGAFAEHKGEYCNDNHNWAFTSTTMNQTECAAKCTELKCGCFDFRDGPAPSPAGGLSARTVFPGFQRNTGPADALPCFSYHGVFPSMSATTVGKYSDSHQGGIPLTIYDPSDAALPALVFSPLNYPKAHHMTSADSFFGAGIKSTVQEIPAGWTQSFILSAGYGINDGMMAWGDRVLKVTGKKRADMFLDEVHSTIGFWTDNGGYYHYSTGGNGTYEEVLPKVKAYHDSLGLPFGHWQFDSWFYPKDGAVGPGGGGGAVTNWTSLPSVFPHGMAYIQSKLKVPMVMHNRQWSDKSDYIKNEPFKWYTSKFAIPEDPVAFFTWFFKQQQGWGLKMYEQDWMCTEYDGVTQLQQNISMGDLWLVGMATGAASSNRTVQFCMPYPNDVMAAAALPAVTNARATGDYFHAHNQWAVGGTALFYWAIGVLPFKDGFYSSNNKQVGGQTVGPETNPDREALMATLSCAMVGPMDGINLINASRTMQSCRKDGRVLKPDRPITTTDACFVTGDPTCYVFQTYSDIGTTRVHYLFSNDVMPITPAMVYVSDPTKYVVYNWYSQEVLPLAASTTVAAGYEDHIYALVTPILSGGEWAFVGEVDKYVSACSQRFQAITPAASGFSVGVVGVANESVKVCAAQKAGSAWKLVCQTVTLSAAGTKTATFPPAGF